MMQIGPRGSNKVSAIAEQLSGQKQEPEKPTVQRSVRTHYVNSTTDRASLVLLSIGRCDSGFLK